MSCNRLYSLSDETTQGVFISYVVSNHIRVTHIAIEALRSDLIQMECTSHGSTPQQIAHRLPEKRIVCFSNFNTTLTSSKDCQANLTITD